MLFWGLILVKVNDFEGIKRHSRKNNNNMGEEERPVCLESVVFYILLITKKKTGRVNIEEEKLQSDPSGKGMKLKKTDVK